MERLYWKGRKIKNAVLFKIKAFFHKRRDEQESKKDDLLFEKSVVKEVIKVFIKNICIIALILLLEQILVSEKCDGIFSYGLQKWIIKTNALVVEDRSLLIDVLSAIVGVAGVFLGLYCANIMSMYAEKYANAPQSISRLFENDIVSNKCIKAITNYLIFSVVVLFLQIIQIDIGIIMLIVLGVKALKIIVSFAFMSRRTYVELVRIFNKDKKLIGIKLIRFRNNIQVHIGKKIYYVLRKCDGKIVTGKIDTENVISFKLRDIGYSKSYFKKLFRKLHKYDTNFLKLSMDSKSGFEMDVYEKKHDYELLKLGHNVRWLGRKFDNYYVNEPYLLYIKMEEMKLKEAMLSQLLSRYNEKLANVGKKYGFLGKICFDSKTSKYSDLYKDLMKGMKNCEEVSGEI